MTKRVMTIENQAIMEHDEGFVTFVGDMDIDADGSGGNRDNDPYFQPETTLKYKGKSLNAYEVPFMVVPGPLVKGVRPIVMGSKGRIVDLKTGKFVDCVVADAGPSKKIGEASVAAAKALGINANPNHGGVDEQRILYIFWPGVPAVVNGVTYDLQSAV